MPAVHDDAICIRHWDWSETSQTVTLFARRTGVVRALAKGARRPKAPYSGGIELLTRAEAGLIIRPSSELALLTEWDLRETFPALRRSLAAFHAGMYMADLVQRFVRDHDPHVALFESLLAALRALAGERGTMSAVLVFQWAVLKEAGFRPRLGDEVEAIAAPVPRAYRFDPVLGGVMPDDGSAPPAGAWLVRRETIEHLRRVARSDNGPAAAAPVARAAKLLGAYIRHLLGEEPRTQALVLGRLPRQAGGAGRAEGA